ncbi:uncharacterized protein PAC_16184 [Phialocephala subalpina]|uniref:Uncharacterized protein n=1 Tax=Phialocephala subalpina TaxID=576137 RepID=A0A1L7XMM9_9HELO|nr:uncharacterized protein PAC_16184 [Phialocephala subalpina]
MDGLRKQALERFLRDEKFKGQTLPRVSQHVPLITVSKFQTVTTLSQSRISSADIHKEVNESIGPLGRETLEASLRITRVDRDFDRTLLVTQEAFMDLFNACNLDHYWLHMLRCAIYGFYQRDQPLVPPLQGSLYSFYVHTTSYSILWSYNTHTSSTRAIIITRGCDRLKDRDAIFYQFLQSLDRHKVLINEPLFLSFLVGVDLVEWIDDNISEELISIRNIEAGTGHSVWVYPGETYQSPNAEELAEMSKHLGASCLGLANVIRHVSIAKKLLKELVKRKDPSRDTTAGSAKAESHSSVETIADAAVMLHAQNGSAEQQAVYLQERARTQQSIIFCLLSREDANASKQLAEAAMKDSYSMKAIAIMTMLFLPATFFAALFALPLFDWEHSPIVKPRFKIYLAFTLPCTCLVWLIWYAMAYRKSLRIVVGTETRRGTSDRKQAMITIASSSKHRLGNY